MSKGFASTPRIALLAFVVLLVFGGIGARLVWLHILDRDELLRYVEKARRQILVQTARRGDILDTHGAILATSRSLIVLGVDPQALVPGDEKKWPQLADLLGMPLAQLEGILRTKSRPAQAVAVKAPGTPWPVQSISARNSPFRPSRFTRRAKKASPPTWSRGRQSRCRSGRSQARSSPSEVASTAPWMSVA